MKTPRAPISVNWTPALARRAAGLVPDRVALAADDHVVARPRQHAQRDLVGHRAGRQPERGLLAEQRGDALLQRVDGRVLAELVVADRSGGHRRAHRRRRPRDGVGAKVDRRVDVRHAANCRRCDRALNASAGSGDAAADRFSARPTLPRRTDRHALAAELLEDRARVDVSFGRQLGRGRGDLVERGCAASSLPAPAARG